MEDSIWIRSDSYVALWLVCDQRCDSFPKTQTASCLMTSAPAEVPSEQLEELNILLTKAEDL